MAPQAASAVNVLIYRVEMAKSRDADMALDEVFRHIVSDLTLRKLRNFLFGLAMNPRVG